MKKKGLDIGFTQLGRRISAEEKRDLRRKPQLTVAVLNRDSTRFSARLMEQIDALFSPELHTDSAEKGGGLTGEVLIIDMDPSAERNDYLLETWPRLRILLPTRSLTPLEGVFLAARESAAPQLLLIDSCAVIEQLDLPAQLKRFQREPDLFAVGPALIDENGTQLSAVVKAFFDRERMHMIDGNRETVTGSLLLKGYSGIYDREKLLRLERPPVFSGLWEEADHFFGAWGRGWRVKVDPAFQILLHELPGSVDLPSGKGRLRYLRNEIRFLRRNFRDRESRRLRRRFLLKQSMRELFRLHPLLFWAVVLELFRSWNPFKKLPKREGLVYTIEQIFDQLME